MRRDEISRVEPSPLARRIGPVFGVDDLVRWIRRPSGLATAVSVSVAAGRKELVAFLSSDGEWAFPEWAFERVDGHLELRDGVAELWRALPHDGFLTAADLCAWMNTRFVGLSGTTPAAYVSIHGMDESVMDAVGRLNARVR